MNQIREENRNCIVTLPGFSLQDTLDCGQSFRWEYQEDGCFYGTVNNRFQKISQQQDDIIFYNTNRTEYETFWKHYFDFDTNYTAIQQQLCSDDTLHKAIQMVGGIRILRQDPWETLCSFIISQNNNIPRIKGIISRFCSFFGEPLTEQVYTFPTPERIAKLTVEELAPLRAGFRAKYLLDAAQKVVSQEINFTQISQGTLAEGEEQLRKIYGVGAKVAQCVLLFGFYKMDAFPIDTWIKKVLTTYYPNGFPTQAKPYAGIAQQYLFHYVRTYEKQL